MTATLRGRSIFGQRGASMGFWASPPSVDVVSGAEADFLVSTSSNVTNLAYIGKGSTRLNTSNTRSILFGRSGKLFNPAPIVWAQPYDAIRKNLLVPSLQPNSPFESFTGFPPRYSLHPESLIDLDQLHIHNLTTLSYNLQFIVFAISGVDN